MISPYGPGWIGGISKFTMSLSEALRRIGLECEVVVHEGGVPGLTTQFGGTKILLAIRAGFWMHLHTGLVRRAHGQWYALLPAVIYKRLHRDAKIMFSVHTPPRRAPRFASWLLAKLMSRCDVVTGVSEETVRWLSRFLPRDVTILKIHPGATIQDGAYLESRHKLAIPDACFVATFVGPLYWSEKVAGVKLLARAFQDFARSVPETRLFVVGGGPLLSEIRNAVADFDPNTQVVLVGETADASPYIHACDVYTHVSYMEGLPLSLLEAMLAGKAVIASNVGDIPDLVRTGAVGILVTNDKDDITAALSALHRN